METLKQWIPWSDSKDLGKPLPKPWGFPIVGNLPQLGSSPHLTLTRIGETYGSLYGLRLGSWDAVVVNSLGAAREALVQNSDAFSSRPPGWRSLQLHGSHNYSVAFGDYDSTQIKRKKALLKLLHNTILSNSDLLDNIINQEVTYLIRRFPGTNQKPVDPRDMTKLAIFRAQFRMAFGDPVDDQIEEELVSISLKAREFQERTSAAILADFMPWMRFAVRKQCEELEESIRILFDFVRKIYHERKHQYETEEKEFCTASACVKRVSSFLKPTQISHMEENEERKQHQSQTSHMEENEARKQHQSHTSHMENEARKPDKAEIENQIIYTLTADTFGAGLENISAGFLWALAYVASYEELQQDLHEELMSVVGVDRQPSLHDKTKMPLMQATILEALRLSSVLPLALPHYCIKDCTVKGYAVNKGTLVLLNLWGINHDPTYFSHPYCFEPYRFLDLSGQLRGDRCSTALTFSSGPRSCAGNAVAKAFMFLMMAGILQKYKLKAMQQGTTIQPLSGATQYPDAYKVAFIPWDLSAEGNPQ